ncbi:MAG TPA: rhodanese-like domain-containing protein [Chitinophagaceae bacterium]|nr:rhodanese-like domain-containing protein [Chitinophagaceae bacterium]
MLQPITKQQIEELQQQNNTVKLIDIRPPAEYEKMHVPGSLNIPAETFTENIAKLDTNDTIVCICTKGLERSQNAAKAISAMGFAKVFYLEDGAVGWLAE